jgi:hypothetical protein
VLWQRSEDVNDQASDAYNSTIEAVCTVISVCQRPGAVMDLICTPVCTAGLRASGWRLPAPQSRLAQGTKLEIDHDNITYSIICDAAAASSQCTKHVHLQPGNVTFAAGQTPAAATTYIEYILLV